MLRLLNLPTDVQTYLREGKLSAGHARALITADDPSGLAKQIVAKGLSVRETERLAAKPKSPEKGTKEKAHSEKDADTMALERDLSAATGMKVTIDHKTGAETGSLTIRYGTLDQLDELCQKLGG
jgi:ParB family transcriptional regulator, chromosome partitioning protein